MAPSLGRDKVVANQQQRLVSNISEPHYDRICTLTRAFSRGSSARSPLTTTYGLLSGLQKSIVALSYRSGFWRPALERPSNERAFLPVALVTGTCRFRSSPVIDALNSLTPFLDSLPQGSTVWLILQGVDGSSVVEEVWRLFYNFWHGCKGLEFVIVVDLEQRHFAQPVRLSDLLQGDASICDISSKSAKNFIGSVFLNDGVNLDTYNEVYRLTGATATM